MRDRDEPVTSSVPRRDDSGRILLAYVDESYSSDHFSLGALVVGGEAARRVEEGLDEIVDEYAGRFGVETDTELHGRPMFQGVGGWSRVPTRVRISVYERSLAVVAGSGARILLRGMDVGRQRRRYARPHPPHEVVLAHLLEQIDAHASEQRAQALVLADEVHNSERHRTNFRDFRTEGTPGYQSSRLRNLLDTIHFAPSHHSRLLQAADLVTYLHRRRQTHVERDVRAATANDRIWAPISDVVAHDWCWLPEKHEGPVRRRGPRRCGRPSPASCVLDVTRSTVV